MIDLSVAIGRPPAAVYAMLADIQDFEPIPRSAEVRMIKEPTGPTTTGTRWHEWVKVAPGCWFHVESVVTAADPPHRLGMTFHSRWLIGRLSYEIEPVAAGSVLHHRETVRTRKPVRWLSRFVERRMRPRLLQRLSDIKAVLEGAP
ncbi:SRPBCC family protein [Nocardia mexicana]|uniref:Polyketide cyclase/dehydrase/lipid transport protein n=1 Tax=Nocardia mexicana TaxID=279262 RepID=A0A370HD90_9NOCA|nr:SRPBCC family protein [Nocardia mexicana]RDI55203.1 polyketide cyclase/dehydrase/lipid transport protein [Nocardia mexicana]